jgi:hypothetical protein
VPGGRRLKSGDFTKNSVFAAVDDRLRVMAEPPQSGDNDNGDQGDKKSAALCKSASKAKRRR